MKKPKITLRQLSAFWAIADKESVTLAAQQISLTQSATSQALQELEKQIGASLFTRSGKRMILNENGRRLLPEAQQVLHHSKQAQNLFTQTGSILKVGASRSIGEYLLPYILPTFFEKNPVDDIYLTINDSQIICEEVAKFNLDIGFIEAPFYHPKIILEPWREDKMLVVAATSHPISKIRDNVSLRDLQNTDWIFREKGSGSQQIFETQILAQLKKVENKITTNSISTIKRLIMQGLGIGLLSWFTVKQEIQAGILCSLNLPFNIPVRTFFIVRHHERMLGTDLQRFILLANQFFDKQLNIFR